MLPLHAWVASAESSSSSNYDEGRDGAECRDTLVALWIREEGCRKQMSSLRPLRAAGQRIDRTSAEWISGQMLYEHVITCSVSHSPSTPLTILACQFVIRTQQNDSAPADLRGRGVGTQQDRLSGVLLIMLRHLNYVRVDTVSCKVYNMSKPGS